MLDFLKTHWPELLVGVVIIALLGGLSPIIMPALAITTVIDICVYAVATVVLAGFGYAITNSIRTRNEPDFPWFEGITEGSTKSVITDIANDEEESQAVPLMDVTEETPLLDQAAHEVKNNIVTSSPVSLHERIKSFENNLAADAKGVTYKPGS